MAHRISLLLGFLSLWLISSCTDAPQYPLEPEIFFDGLSENRIFQFTNGPLDSLVINFSFTDGDGDLSLPSNNDSVDVFLRDSRLPQLPITYRFPFIGEEGIGNGISGDARITIINEFAGICCIYQSVLCAEDPEYPLDTFSYSIQIRDRAGNFSNVIQTEVIEIVCL